MIQYKTVLKNSTAALMGSSGVNTCVRGGTIKKIMSLCISFSMLFLIVMVTPSNQTSGAYIWTDRGCGAVYSVYDPITVYFKPIVGYEFEVWSYHSGLPPQLISAGVGEGYTYYRTGTVGPPAGQITFVLSMSCSYECIYCGMCDYGECTVFVQDYLCECPNKCYGDDLWAMECIKGVCYKDHIVEKNSAQCGYDPCKNVECTTACNGYDLWVQKCVDGRCVDDRLLEANSISCGYDPCTGIVCRDVCKGVDLWSQRCEDGACVDDRLLEADSTSCGFDPCQDHCTNGQQDCGESGVDCGGGCPVVDSDNDGIEDCRDLCPGSRCNMVDTTGCETDVDGDGVFDCEDDCLNEQGDAANRGCPSDTNMLLIFGGIGAAIAVGGSLALWGLRGGRPPGEPRMQQMSRSTSSSSRPISRPTPQEIAMRQEAAEQIAKETAEEVARSKTGSSIAEAATKEAGTKMAEAATKEAGTKMAEAATKEAGTKMAEAATKEVGTKMAEAATKEAGTKMAEAATKEAGTKMAEAAAGAGVAGVVAKRQKETFCPKCGEKLPLDSKFCSKCGQKI